MEPHPGLSVTPNVRLIRPLGCGGMGSVWLAEHLALDTRVAVKFISPDVPKSLLPALLERFQREAKAAAKIRSPHVVEVKDLGAMREGGPFIVMELLEGESLGDRLERTGTMSPREAAAVIGQVAKALSAAHCLGVLHRDIKPDNIFLLTAHDDLLVKVLDFGIAKIADVHTAERSLTATDSLLGTPDYMSPEQLLSPKNVDQRTDLWALAVVAYRMLTGRLPFTGETVTALSMAICAARFPKPSSISKALSPAIDDWFSRALTRERADRFSSAKEFAAAFSRAADGGVFDSGEHPVVESQAARARPDGAAKENAWKRIEWMVRTDAEAEPVGPASLDQIERGIKAGKVPTEAQIAQKGSVQWLRASLVLLEYGKSPVERTVPEAPPESVLAGADPSFGVPFDDEAATLYRSSGTVAAEPGALFGVQDAGAPPALVFPPESRARSLAGAAKTLPRPIGTNRLRPVHIGLGVAVIVGAMIAIVAVRSGESDVGSIVASAGPSAPAGARVSATTVSSPREKRTPKAPPKEMAAVSTPSGDFAIMVREVTMEQYDECVAKSTCPNAGKQKGCNWQVEGMEQRPINCVNWQAAVAYCAGHGWRLPTDEEWESAAEQLPSLGATVREWISSDAASGGKVARANRRSKTVRTTESPADLKADLGFRCAVSL